MKQRAGRITTVKQKSVRLKAPKTNQKGCNFGNVLMAGKHLQTSVTYENHLQTSITHEHHTNITGTVNKRSPPPPFRPSRAYRALDRFAIASQREAQQHDREQLRCSGGRSALEKTSTSAGSSLYSAAVQQAPPAEVELARLRQAASSTRRGAW